MVLRLLEHPGPTSRYYDFNHRYRLTAGGVFVFGSNLAGRHGKGAALEAKQVYGAHYGVGKGFTGMSFAIPTKDQDLRILPLNEIEQHIRDFVWASEACDMDNRPLWFYVTPVGTGLAQYSHEQIAPMFQGVSNCWLPDIWRPYLGSHPSVYLSRQLCPQIPDTTKPNPESSQLMLPMDATTESVPSTEPQSPPSTSAGLTSSPPSADMT